MNANLKIKSHFNEFSEKIKLDFPTELASEKECEGQEKHSLTFQMIERRHENETLKNVKKHDITTGSSYNYLQQKLFVLERSNQRCHW